MESATTFTPPEQRSILATLTDWLTLLLSLAVLAVSIWLMLANRANMQASTEIDVQQQKLQQISQSLQNANAIVQQVGPAIVKDITLAATQDKQLNSLLIRYGFAGNTPSTPPSPASAAAPAPAAPPASSTFAVPVSKPPQ